DVAALPAGDSAYGCRQMTGNVWEWTADAFLPYPGFVADPYNEYSQPWFGTHKVLRGGCWGTRGRVLPNTRADFCTPDPRAAGGRGGRAPGGVGGGPDVSLPNRRRQQPPVSHSWVPA